MSDEAVHRVGVVGAGTIGASWAAYFLAQSIDVAVIDPSPQADVLVRRTVENAWPFLERMGLKVGASPDRIAFAPTGALDLDGVDFI